MKNMYLMLAAMLVLSSSVAQATVFSGAMDNRAGLPFVAGLTAQSPAWVVGGDNGEGMRLEWRVDDETAPGSWTYTYKLIRGTARNKGFAYFDIETAADFQAANILGRQVLSATDRQGNPVLSAITISDPLLFNAVHDFSNEGSIATVLDKDDLSHYSGDPGRVPPGTVGGNASATVSVGPVAHPFRGVRVKFPGSFSNLAYVVSEWEFRIVSDRVPMWGSFFGWGDQTFVPPFWYANVYNDNIDTAHRLTLAPVSSLSGADPYRGWILVPGPLPEVLASNPADTAIDVPVTEPVTAVFGGLMDPATITSATFVLADVTNGGTAVPGTVSYDATTLTATFTPAAQLIPGNTYSATILSGPSGVKDLAGNPLAVDKTWSFATAVTDQIPPTVTVQLPDNGARNTAVDTTVTARFSEEIDSATVTTSSFTVADSSGPLPGTVGYDPATRTAIFMPTAPLANNTVYTATLTTGVEDLSGNTLAQDEIWTFTTIPQETVLPLVSATVPAAGGANVAVSSAVRVTFSEAMDPATINPSTFTVAGVAGTVSYDGATRTATFTPASPLASATTYSATISTGVRDLAGNALPLIKEWSFRTGTPDFVLPTVTGTQPAAAAVNIPLVTSITVAFSELMNPATIGPASFTLTGRTFSSAASFAVSGMVNYNNFTSTAHFSPLDPLVGGTAYTATVTTTVTDTAGNPLTEARIWNFTTQPDGILTPGGNATTIGDALKALRIVVNLIVPTADDYNHGDVAPLGTDNKPRPDGQITLQDALVLLRKSVGLVNW